MCQVDEPTSFKCANCGESRHAAGDRTYLKFEAMRKQFAANNKANSYKFFIMGEDRSTWERWEEGGGGGPESESGRETHEEGEETSRLQRAARGLENGHGVSLSWEDDIENGQEPEQNSASNNKKWTQTTLAGWATSQPSKERNNYKSLQNE